MVIAINEYSDVPIYLQIRNQIVIGISDGKLKPGEQLPTVRRLAEEIGINSMTVNKAYQMLKQEGYIYTDRRNGAKVREQMEFSDELSKESILILDEIGNYLEDFPEEYILVQGHSAPFETEKLHSILGYKRRGICFRNRNASAKRRKLQQDACGIREDRH